MCGFAISFVSYTLTSGNVRAADAVVSQIHLGDGDVGSKCLAQRLHASLQHANAIPFESEKGQRPVVRKEGRKRHSAVGADVAVSQVERFDALVLTKHVVDDVASLIAHECVAECHHFRA